METELAFTKPRYKKLEWELRHALSKTSNEEYKKWALYTSLVFPQIAVRRAKNIGEFAGKIVKGTYSEAKDFVQAGIKWKLLEHTKQRTASCVQEVSSVLIISTIALLKEKNYVCSKNTNFVHLPGFYCFQ